MKLELLRAADYVLNSCGRLVPPPGYRFVDLPRVIPFHFDTIGTIGPAAPFNRAITNTAETVFLARGFVLSTDYMVRLKWPSGRFLSQQLLFQSGAQASPQGTGGTMLALPSEEPIDPDGRITVQISNLAGGGTTVDLHLWGVLRYLLKEDSNGGTTGPGSSASCIVGYASIPKPSVNDPALMDDPVYDLETRPRYGCTPNGNIMAPEWALGNQCTPETPDGWQDESFTFFSPVVAVPGGGEVYDVAVIVPGGGEDVVVKSLTFYVTLVGEAFSAIPLMQMRLPNGYSVMGGDMIPIMTDNAFIPYVFTMPVFPTLRVPAGQRIILDFADMFLVGSGTSEVLVQFDGVKRRRLQ
jgi:hypothetical protein